MTAAPIPFLNDASPGRPLLCDDSGAWVDAAALAEQADAWREGLGARTDKGLCMVAMTNTVAAVAALLGAWAAGRAVALVSARLPADAWTRLVSAHAPDEIIAPALPPLAPYEVAGGRQGLMLWRRQGPALPPPHQECALLLSTSGSTGSPKMVRLRLESLLDNAGAIAERLGIDAEDVAYGHLPLDYSYGLSVLTSHLVRGARVLLTERSMMERAFWEIARQAAITHLPGVPTHYRMLTRLGLARLNLPTLRSMTQAGGKLDLELQDQAHAFMEARGGAFHVMYGQTEASPRITTLRHEDFARKRGSVGTVLRGGCLSIEDGQVIYRGTNVMMGYAATRAELALPDQLGGVLRTGDCGSLDADGFLTLTGRLNRIAKVQGWRIDLDEVESALAEALGCAVAAVDRGETVRIATEGAAEPLREVLAARFALPPHVFEILAHTCPPMRANGKPDYAALRGEP